MKEDEDIGAYFLWIDEIVNTMREMGKGIESLVIVQKTLRSLPVRFDSKLLAM